MGEPLGDLLAQHMSAHPLPADGLIAVPLHPRRLAERGFNQSDLLARRLSMQCKIPFISRGLMRNRDTAHQVGLDAQERRANVGDAFVWQHDTPPPARALLIDDVLTTGATLEACAQALRAAGSREVRALVLARSQ
jgi:ComF family protein